MRTTTHLIVRYVALVLLAMTSCARNEEHPTPKTGQSKGENIKALKEVFLAKGYDQQFILPLNSQTKTSWALRWEQASQTRITDSVAYVYVPLDAPAVAWMGVKKYLLVKRVGSELDFRMATYLFKEKENVAWNPVKPSSFFAAYTGELLLKHLATGETFRYVYRCGAVQDNSIPISVEKQSKQRALGSSEVPALINGLNHATSDDCYDNVTCYWSSVCGTDGAGSVVGTLTSGINSCPTPSEAPCSSDYADSRSHWTHTGTTRERVCFPTSPAPDPGPGPSDPGPSDPGPVIPCFGTVMYNPHIAPSRPGNYRGGMYGYTRNGGKKLHDGIDIYAVPGSLVGAAQAGVVTRIERGFSPGQYREKSYGNFVEVRSEVNGVVTFLKYNHLDQVIDGLTVGSVISQESVIGYSGTTGNAADAGVVPHVHIQAKDGSGHRADPAPHLGTIFDPATGQGTPRPC